MPTGSATNISKDLAFAGNAFTHGSKNLIVEVDQQIIRLAVIGRGPQIVGLCSAQRLLPGNETTDRFFNKVQ